MEFEVYAISLNGAKCYKKAMQALFPFDGFHWNTKEDIRQKQIAFEQTYGCQILYKNDYPNGLSFHTDKERMMFLLKWG